MKRITGLPNPTASYNSYRIQIGQLYKDWQNKKQVTKKHVSTQITQKCWNGTQGKTTRPYASGAGCPMVPW